MQWWHLLQMFQDILVQISPWVPIENFLGWCYFSPVLVLSPHVLCKSGHEKLLRDVKWLTPGHSTGQWLNKEQNPGSGNRTNINIPANYWPHGPLAFDACPKSIFKFKSNLESLKPWFLLLGITKYTTSRIY